MTSKNVELKSVKSKDGRQPIYIRITKNRKHTRISTNIKVFKKDFNPKAKYGSWIRVGEPKHKVYNQAILETLSKLENQDLDKEFNIRSLKEKKSFFEYAEEEISYYSSVNKERSSEKLRHAKNKLMEYMGEGVDLTFFEITPLFLKKYESYLISVKENHINTVQADFKRIKTCINNAIREGAITNFSNPFLNYKIKSVVTNKDKLKMDEIKKIEDKEFLKGSAEWHAKNYFLFSFYCAGIRFGDICTLKWGNVVEDRLVYTMSKIEGKKASFRNLKLTEKHKAILKQYGYGASKDLNTLIFPLLNFDPDLVTTKHLKKQISSKNVTTNRALKSLRVRCGIKTNITFHIARHSFADIARKQTKFDLLAISKALGHSNIQTTMTYLGIDDKEDQDDLVDAVINS